MVCESTSGFEQELDSNPSNDLRLIYADYLEDIGNYSLAWVQRYMVKHNVRPYTYNTLYNPHKSNPCKTAYWTSTHNISIDIMYNFAIPIKYYNHIAKNYIKDKDYINTYWIKFINRQTAEYWFAKAVEALGED